MKICLICFGFNNSNIRLQPWRYIDEISKRMSTSGYDIKIITDGYPSLPKRENKGADIYRLKNISTFPFTRNSELIELIEKESPDVVLLSMGITSFLLFKTIKEMRVPILGLWMGSNYNLIYISSLAIRELIHNFESIKEIVISALIPKIFTRFTLKMPNFKKIIVLTKNNRNELLEYGYPLINISIIPPGIDQDCLEKPEFEETAELREKMELEENSFIILYFGSPLSLRGTDTIINAVSLIYKEIPSLKLVVLSRIERDSLYAEEDYIRNLSNIRGLNDRITIISGSLDKKIVRNFIALSDVVVLPFKIVQSDMPIGIMEAMAIGKPVISTRLDGIPELLEDGRGCVINPNDARDLANALISFYLNPQLKAETGKNARDYMLNYSSWNQTAQAIMTLINEITDEISNSNTRRL